MGSVTYDFLANSVLFNDDEISNHYSSLNDSQLENVLQDYRQHCLTNFSDLIMEIKESKSSLKVLSSIEKMPFEMLKQGALYFDQFVIYDPLFIFTHSESEMSKVVSEYLGFQKNGIDRKGLSAAVKLLKLITPMIAANYVKILPMSYNFEPPKDVSINLPVNYYADILPQDILTYFQENAIVRSMKQEEEAWRILDNNDLTPGLFITFKDYEEHEGSIYNFFYKEFVKIENSNQVLSKMTLADYPMDRAQWDVWVSQSINSASKAVFDKIYIENLIANDINATYLTNNTFVSNFLTKNLSSTDSVETATATQFMNLDLPFLDIVDIDKLMSIRIHEEDIFTNFRIELERCFRELRTISDPYELKICQENIMHELGVVQVRKINKKLDSLKRKSFVDAAILLGGLAGTVQTAGWSLLATSLATFSGYKTYQEYKTNLTENPSYLLWKVLKK